MKEDVKEKGDDDIDKPTPDQETKENKGAEEESKEGNEKKNEDDMDIDWILEIIWKQW